MSINVKRCYFHSIQPLINYKDRKSHLEEVIDRLEFLLDIGYLVPGKELYELLPVEYRRISLLYNQNDSVFLAQHIATELKPIGGSYINGPFSAYLEHISGSPALVFDESVTNHKKIEKRRHPLSEEVCIQEKIPLTELIALSLPYKTPIDEIQKILEFEEKKNHYPEEFLTTLKKEYQQKLETILQEGTTKIKEIYDKIELFQNCLEKHDMHISCIRENGVEFNQAEEYPYLEEHREKIMRLIY